MLKVCEIQEQQVWRVVYICSDCVTLGAVWISHMDQPTQAAVFQLE